MASLINPICGVPIFEQTDQATVETCGKLSGRATSIFFIIAIIILCIVTLISSAKEEKDPKTGKTKKKYNWWILGVGAISSLLIFFLFPPMVKFFTLRSWQTSQQHIKQCMKQGKSRKACIDNVQQWEETQARARATRESGSDIASAIRDSNRNKY